MLSYAVGRNILSRASFHNVAEEVAFCASLGLGIIATTAFLMGLARVLYVELVMLLAVLAMLGSYRVLRDGLMRLRAAVAGASKASLARFAAAVMIAIALASFLSIPALYPPRHHDALSYHLALAKIYTAEHQVRPTPYLRFCVFPQHSEMLFTLMYALWDDISAQLTQFLAFILTALALFGWGTRWFSRRAGIWAAAIWLGTPFVVRMAGMAYVELGVALYATLAILSLETFLRTRQSVFVILAGVFAGFAAGTKYTALFLVLAVGVWMLGDAIVRRAWKPLALLIVGCSVTMMPWYAWNYAHTGNPVEPFMQSIFGSERSCWLPGDLESHQSNYEGRGAGTGFLDFLALPARLVNQPAAFRIEEPSRTLFLALPLTVLIALVDRSGARILLFVLAYLIFWFNSAQVVRYLFPVLPLVALLEGAAASRIALWLRLDRFKRMNAVVTLTLGIVLLIPSLQLVQAEVTQQGSPPVSESQREKFFTALTPAYPCFQWLNARRGSDYRLYAFFASNLAYFTDGTHMGDHFGPARYRDIDATSAAGLHRSLSALDTDYLLVLKGQGFHKDPERIQSFMAPLIIDAKAFTERFHLVCTAPDVYLFELQPEPYQLRRGPELIRNGGFEEGSGANPVNWAVSGHARREIDMNKSSSPRASVALWNKGRLSTQVNLDGGRVYLVTFRSSGDASGGMDVIFRWLDASKEPLMTQVETVETAMESKRTNLFLSAPLEAGFLELTFEGPFADRIRVEDVSMAHLISTPSDLVENLVDPEILVSIWRPEPMQASAVLGKGALIANPNPVPVCDGSGLGVTTLSWTVPPGVGAVEVRIGSVDGALFARTSRGSSQSTGKWATDGMKVFLQDRSGGRPLTSRNTIAMLEVGVDSKNCR